MSSYLLGNQIGARYGSLNQDQEAFGNVQQANIARDEAKAFCSSGTCAGRTGTASRKVLKIVPRSEINCPDCGHMLFWKM